MTTPPVAPMRLFLRNALGTERPKFRWEMTPEMAYGRHRGPARVRSRQAAVAVVLMHDEDRGWMIPLTRRSTTLRHHGGQICFPGGRIEAGETAELAALREFHEELGVDLGKITACGQLPQQFVYASDNEVAPLVFVTERPRTDWDPAPVEVDEVLEVPLSALLSNSVIESTSQNRRIRLPCVESEPSSSNQFKHFRSGPGNPAMHFRFLAPAYVHRENRIWGATAMILNQLAQCLLPFQTRAEAGPMDAKMAATSVRT